MRIFLAVPVPPPAADLLSAAQRKLRGLLPEARWVDRNFLHLTVKFLGDTGPVPVDEIAEAARKSVEPLAPFRAGLKGLGAFPSATVARVLWAGVDEGSSALVRLAGELDRRLAALGFLREDRPYRPHVTLGRLREDADLSAVFEQTGFTADFGAFEVNRLDVMRSDLRPKGPLYETLHSCPFKERGCPRT